MGGALSRCQTSKSEFLPLTLALLTFLRVSFAGIFLKLWPSHCKMKIYSSDSWPAFFSTNSHLMQFHRHFLNSAMMTQGFVLHWEGRILQQTKDPGIRPPGLESQPTTSSSVTLGRLLCLFPHLCKGYNNNIIHLTGLLW